MDDQSLTGSTAGQRLRQPVLSEEAEDGQGTKLRGREAGISSISNSHPYHLRLVKPTAERKEAVGKNLRHSATVKLNKAAGSVPSVVFVWTTVGGSLHFFH